MGADIRRRSAWRLALWGGVGAALLLPLVAMQFTYEVNWTATDFLFAGALLLGGGALWEVALWRAKSLRARVLIGGAILLVVSLIWAEGAVGIL